MAIPLVPVTEWVYFGKRKLLGLPCLQRYGTYSWLVNCVLYSKVHHSAELPDFIRWYCNVLDGINDIFSKIKCVPISCAQGLLVIHLICLYHQSVLFTHIRQCCFAGAGSIIWFLTIGSEGVSGVVINKFTNGYCLTHCFVRTHVYIFQFPIISEKMALVVEVLSHT